MFERFTERARQVVVFAQEEARALRHNYIGTEHLLLGLAREEEGVAARVLDALEIRVEEVRAQVARIVGDGDEVTTGQIPFTPRAKRVLELSLKEALGMRHSYIGTEHILLGLVRENEGVAARIMLDLGADAEKIQAEVLRTLGLPRGAVPAPPQPGGRRFRRRGGQRGSGFWPPGQPRFEYRVLEAGGDDLATELNKLGHEGWELVTAVGERLILKRLALF